MKIYDDYLRDSLLHLRSVIQEMGCRPILFVGAGLSKRYLQAPSWPELLEYLVSENPKLDMPFGFYSQRADHDLPKVASLLEDGYQTYAWEQHGSGLFPDYLYTGTYSKGIFLKHKIASLFTSLTEKVNLDLTDTPTSVELKLLSKVEPHAVITTNYDGLMEKVFPFFNPIIGQKIIRKPVFEAIGEILKVHGCASEPESLVISHEDYQEFMRKKKYLTAKLLTYFIEFPLIIMGYSVSDMNIKEILSDIAEMVPGESGDLVGNIWFVDWQSSFDQSKRPPSEKVIDLGDGRSIRVNYLLVDSFGALFETISQPVAVKQIDVRYLRNLMTNIYDIVKNKSANASLSVNIATLDSSSTESNLMNVLGFGTVSDPDAIALLYPYSLSDVGKKLGYKSWYHVDRLIKQVKLDTGFDVKFGNNKYHLDVGLNGNHNGRYSQALVEVLGKVKKKEPYSLVDETGQVREPMKILTLPGTNS